MFPQASDRARGLEYPLVRQRLLLQPAVQQEDRRREDVDVCNNEIWIRQADSLASSEPVG